MSFQTIYKRLVTLRVLHSFYLDSKDGVSFYERPPIEQEDALSHYNIMEDIDFVPTDDTLTLMRAYSARWHTTEHGFFIGIEVDPMTKPTYKPLRILPEGGEFRLAFKMILKNPLWRSFTNIRLRPTDLPFGFYFTNDDGDKKNYPPSVSTPVKPFKSVQVYEMGEIVLQNKKIYRANTKIKAGAFDATNWTLLDATRFHNDATESDRRLLPTRFASKLTAEEIKAKGIVFSDAIEAPRCLGIIEIVHRKELLNGYNLLDTEGVVVGQKLDLRFLNRLTHWHYLEAKKDTLSTFRNGLILDDNLSTRQPQFLTKSLTEIKLNDDIKLPSPTRVNISEKDDRFYTEIVY